MSAPRPLALLLPALLFVSACAAPREVLDVTSVDRPADVQMDSLAAERARSRVAYVLPDRPRRDVAPDRSVDILSTALDLRLDLAARQVGGTATHRLVPLFDGLEGFYLHGVGMEIEAVETLRGPAFTHAYDGARLTLTPSSPLARTDTAEVRIVYTASPELPVASRLGAGQGLYFIDPDGTDPYRPTQVWTQGQPEDNRRWFPTWDYPNDKMTFEIALSVPDSLQTFSNGTRTASSPVDGGFRRDVWRLDTYPHPAYLTAAVAGRFAVTSETYTRPDGTTVPLLYIVEPRFADRAQAIFGETPAMMAAFEAFTGVRYPWADYKQVAVRDFTAGGMENTTLTIMYEGLQSEPRGLLGREGAARDLIAHELAHQWFGNLVTAEDWANLTINEAFATFFEEVYREAAFGRDAAQEAVIADREAYLDEARRTRRPTVWYGFDSVEQLFDRHTYQKGGRVLAQLRFELGDEVFRAGLQDFLTTNAGASVSVDDLRRSMERVSGRSLRRFFSQWFEHPGHPALAVEGAYFPGSGLYTMRVTQTQDRTREPVFHYDVNVELNYPTAPRDLRRIRVTAADTTLSFNVPERPLFVRFNEGDHLLADITLSVAADELIQQATRSGEMAGRYAAVAGLGRAALGPQAREALVAASRDAHPLVRTRALSGLATAYAAGPGVTDRLLDAARNDDDPAVRAEAVRLAAGLPGGARTPGLQAALDAALQDEAYLVIGRAVEAYGRLFPSGAVAAFERAGVMEMTTWGGLVEGPLADALGAAADPRGRARLEALTGPDNADGTRLRALRGLVLLSVARPDQAEAARARLREALGDRLPATRRIAADGLSRIGTRADLDALDARVREETDEAVREAARNAARVIRSRGGAGPFGAGR